MDYMDGETIRGLNNISRFIHLVACQANKCSVMKEFGSMIITLKTLKPVLDESFDSQIPYDCQLTELMEELDTVVNEAREIIEHRHPGSSKINNVLQSELVILNVHKLCEQICTTLTKVLNSPSLISLSANIQCCFKEFRSSEQVQVTKLIQGALNDQRDNIMAALEDLLKISENISLTSNKELLMECIALEKEKVRAALRKDAEEDDHVDQIIALVTQIRYSIAKLDQFTFISGLLIPSYFRCPLSLRIMLDPVIIASGQTYERSFIQKWLDNGLRICPQTHQPLAHINLTPNYTVREMIDNWCQVNRVDLCDYLKADIVHHPSLPNALEGSSPRNGFHSPLTGDLKNSVVLSEFSDEPSLGRPPSTASDILCFEGSSSMKQRSSCHSKSDSISSIISSIEVASKFDDKICLLGEAAFPSPSWLSSNQSLSPSNPNCIATLPYVQKLVEDLKSLSQEEQAVAASGLRNLAKHNAENRVMIAKLGAISPLVAVLSSNAKRVQENAVAALFNLSINDDNKALIADEGAIKPLIHVLESGSIEAKENSAAALFSLSILADCKAKIGQSGAVWSLVDLLGHGSLRGKKDAAAALFNLSILHDNKARIVRAGAVKHLIELLDPSTGMVDKSAALLANLSMVHEGRLAIAQGGGIPLLIEVLDNGSERGKENAASILFQLCINNQNLCSLVLEEGAVPPLIALSQSGTPRAREKAQQILCHFRSQREGPPICSNGRS